MKFSTIKTLAVIAAAAALSACTGGGGDAAPSASANNTTTNTTTGGSTGGNTGNSGSNAGGTVNNSQTVAQTASDCSAPTYPAGSAGAWVMGFRGASGSYATDRGVVCQSSTLDSAAQAMAASVVQGSAMTLAQLRTQWESSYGGQIIDVQHDEAGQSVSDCAEAADFKARSLYIQGRLTHVGAYSVANQNGTYSCVLVAGTKTGTGTFGQVANTDASAVVHIVSQGNYVNRTGTINGYVDINLANGAQVSTCQSNGRCLPATIDAVDGQYGAGNALSTMGTPASTTAEAVDYLANNRAVLLQQQVVDSSIDKQNSTIRYQFQDSCGTDTCFVTIDYTVNGVAKRLSVDYTSYVRGTQAITLR